MSRPAARPLERPSWLPESVWPFHTFAVPIDNMRIAVTDVGHGPTLLFVHTGFWSFIWRDVISQLAADFRCVCFDAPGTGRSDRIPLAGISLGRAARTLTALIAALDLRDITLVVHDLGGLSGIAGAAPFADRIRALACVNSFAWRPSGAFFRGMLGLMGNGALREFDVATGLLPRITSTAFGVGRHMDEASRRAFLSGIGPSGIRAFHAYLRDARVADDIFDEVHSALTGPFRHLPLTTVFGERNDPLGFQPQWKRLFPAARQVVVPRGNHFPMCDAPEIVADAIRGLHQDTPRPK